MAGNDRTPGPSLAVQLSRPYLSSEEIAAQAAAHRGGISDTRELQLRLSACTFIQQLALHLQLCVMLYIILISVLPVSQEQR